MSSVGKHQSPSFAFDDLALWRTELTGVEFAVLPPSNTRPNPTVVDNKVFVSIFSPGAVCALERDTGRLIWRREVTKLAGASVDPCDRMLFAKSPHTLYSLNPESGEVVWTFCPYGAEGEWIYSSPSTYRGRVYIGDRKGFLHCLDANTGESMWRSRTSRAKNDDVNSTPLIISELVIVGTNAKRVVAYDALTGELAWKQDVDGPSGFGLLLHGKSVVVPAQSLYFLNPQTGRVLQRYRWHKRRVAFAESTRTEVVVILRGTSPSKDSSEAIFVDGKGQQRSATIKGFCICFRYSNKTGVLYVSHLHGVDLYSPRTGVLLCKLQTEDRRGGVALVDVESKRIYALTGDGHVYALKHPEVAVDGHLGSQR